MSRFSPYERKCWDESEIQLEHLPYNEDYRYQMSNCLYEAAMQEASGCVPANIMKGDMPCLGKSLKCFNNVQKKLGKKSEVLT